MSSRLNIEQAIELAAQHHQAGRIADAEAIYRQVLSREPNHPESLRMLGLIALGLGRRDDALALLRRAIALAPFAANYQNDLGAVLATSGKIPEAIAAFRQALKIQGDDPAACTNLANALQDAGRLDEAIEHYQRALSITARTSQPAPPETHYNFARALLARGNMVQAIEECRAALSLRSNFAEAHMLLGNALVRQHKMQEAIESYRRAIALRPDVPALWYNLGNALLDTEQLDEAIAAQRHVIARHPHYANAYTIIANAYRLNGDLDQALEWFRESLAIADDPRVASSILFMLPFHPNYDARRICQECKNWDERYARPLRASILPHLNDRSPERRLRIGYVSPDFREHPVGRFMLPLLANHQSEEYEVFCYADVRHPDWLTERTKSHVHQWSNTFDLSDEQLAERVRQNRIDILVDLTMHTHGSRLLAFARKAAPVQITYLAYCGTTGLDAMDYRVSDPFLDPPGCDESIYSERTVRLPRSYWCYPPPERPLDPGELPARATGSPTFGCLNNFSKVNSTTLRTWCEVLRSIPQSRLVLLAPEGSGRNRVRELMSDRGIDPSRLQFVGRMAPLERYLQQYQQIDLALDSFPYPGGTTTFDALWMGVPVITLPGQTAISRSGASILTNAGLPELVARDVEDYVRIASSLGLDIPRLSELRSTLRQRMHASVLMDAPRFTRDFEQIFRTIWREWCNSR